VVVAERSGAKDWDLVAENSGSGLQAWTRAEDHREHMPLDTRCLGWG